MKILKSIRDADSVSVIIQANGKFERRIFPAKMTDKEIEYAIKGIEYKEPDPKAEPAPEMKKEEPKPEPPKKVHEEIADKRTAKARMLKTLKEMGVDTAGLLTFSAVEEVYNRNFKGEN